MTMFDDVGAFHEKFGLPLEKQTEPCIPHHKVVDYRMRFLYEELEELTDAVVHRRLEDTLDALIDIAWVAMGTAHYFGLPFNEGWEEVRRANMAKVLGGGDAHKRGEQEPIRKPIDWQAPEHAKIIAAKRRDRC